MRFRTLVTAAALALFANAPTWAQAPLEPPWAQTPLEPPQGAMYMGLGRMLEAGAPRQLSLRAHVSQFAYQPGGLEIAYTGVEMDADTATFYVRLAGVRYGKTTTLVSTSIPMTTAGQIPGEEPLWSTLGGWSGDGRFLLLRQERFQTGTDATAGRTQAQFVLVDVGAAPIRILHVSLPEETPDAPDTTRLVWWSPDRSRLLFADRALVPAAAPGAAPDARHLADVACVVYDPKQGRTHALRLDESRITRGWLDADHLLLDDGTGTPKSRHYFRYDLGTDDQVEVAKPAKMPADYDGQEEASASGVSPKSASLTLEDEPHRLRDRQGVTNFDSHTLWVRRTQGPKAQSAMPVGLTPGKDNPKARWAPRGDQIAYVSHGDLFVTDLSTRDATVKERYQAGEMLTCPEEQRLAVDSLKQIGLAALMYTQDWDEHFPAGENWQDKLKPYLAPDTLLSIGSHPVMYHAPSNLSLANIETPSETVLGTIDLPCAVVTLYADGHVRALPKQQDRGGGAQ